MWMAPVSLCLGGSPVFYHFVVAVSMTINKQIKNLFHKTVCFAYTVLALEVSCEHPEHQVICKCTLIIIIVFTQWLSSDAPPIVQDKLAEMEKSVANPDLGSDLRGVKELLKKHQALEMDLSSLADTIQSIVDQGKEMANAGHFNSKDILKAVQDFNKRWLTDWTFITQG